MTYCIAVGGVWSALLPRSKGEGMGLLAIALCAGAGRRVAAAAEGA